MDPFADLPDRRPHAVVVGGGIGGLGAARALQVAGWSVAVLEQAERLEPLGAGISLWPNAIVALRWLRVALPERAAVTGTGGLVTDRGRWLRRQLVGAYRTRYGGPLVAVHRAELVQSLLGSLAPGTLRTGTQVTDVTDRGDRVEVRHDRGTDHADLVVLADGLASRTRHLVAGPLPRPCFAGYTAWRGIAPAAAAPADGTGAVETWGRGQRFGRVPLGDRRTYWYATANAPEGQRAPDAESLEVLRRFGGWPDSVRALVAATEPDAVLRHDVYDLRPDPATYVRGRLVLLGDAAHAMTPDLGQGACQALEDAATLGALARPHHDLGTALAGYDRHRRPRAQGVARQSRQVGRIGQLDGPVAPRVRDLLVRAVPRQLAERSLAATVRWQPPSS